MRHCFLFESKSIQGFVLATNRIKEIIGASELIESVTGELLNCALSAADPDETIQFSRCAGGAFYAFSGDAQAIQKLSALWPIAMAQYAPGLEFVASTGVGAHDKAAFDSAYPRLLSDRNLVPVVQPQAGPFVVRSQRSGMPASRYLKGPEAVSESTFRKQFFHELDNLSRRFAPESARKHWPLALTPEDYENGQRGKRDFPFVDDRRLIGVIHADGNGLGQVLMNLRKVIDADTDKFFDVYSDFSALIDKVTSRAAREATRKHLEPHRRDDVYPARPVVLAGEDLTIIVRADLALDFCAEFINQFSKLSQCALKKMRQKYKAADLPERLTACAGIAFVQSSQPYHAAYKLAESLCDYAKTRSTEVHAQNDGAIPSSIAFHRVTTAIIDDFDQILDKEHTHNKLRSTLACYGTEKDSALPKLADLVELSQLAVSSDMARGPTRELLALITDQIPDAKRRYRRWREVLEARQPAVLKEFDELLGKCVDVSPSDDLPFGPEDGKQVRHSPLGDVEMLAHIGGV